MMWMRSWRVPTIAKAYSSYYGPYYIALGYSSNPCRAAKHGDGLKLSSLHTGNT